MPRGRKKAVPAVEENIEEAVVFADAAPIDEAVGETVEIKASKKPYPTTDERIALANAKIDRLTDLNTRRKALIDSTEKVLNERKESLVKSEKALENEITKLNKLLERKNRPETAQAKRELKSLQKAKFNEFIEAFKSSGKSFEELYDFINK